MSDSSIRAIVLFFFYATLDERRSVLASSEAIEWVNQKIKKNPELNHNVLIVAATSKFWKKHKKHIQRGRPQGIDSGWKLPNEVDLSPWKEFQKKAEEDELLALIWCQILKLSEEDISIGLNSTEGTVRFRVGRAVRKLSLFTSQAEPQGLRVVLDGN